MSEVLQGLGGPMTRACGSKSKESLDQIVFTTDDTLSLHVFDRRN